MRIVSEKDGARSKNFQIALVSRIFHPEPSVAASTEHVFAQELAAAGHFVSVLTTKAPNLKVPKAEPGIKVSRWPALRDKNGYIKGIVQYLSFDIPSFFRVLALHPKPDFILVEPPPTTGFMVNLAAKIRRIPYGYRVADLWSQAVTDTDTNKLVQKLLVWVEKAALRGATMLFPVHEGVAERLKEFGISKIPEPIGLGIDTEEFEPYGDQITEHSGKQILLYSGTASQVHGAEIFVEAFQKIKIDFPDAILVFLGQGTSFDNLKKIAANSNNRIEVRPRVASTTAAKWIRSSVATLASVAPGKYGYAFPTKVYASVACGIPVIYSGAERAGKIVSDNNLGIATSYSADAVADAMKVMLTREKTDSAYLRNWAIGNISIRFVGKEVAKRITDYLSDN